MSTCCVYTVIIYIETNLQNKPLIFDFLLWPILLYSRRRYMCTRHVRLCVNVALLLLIKIIIDIVNISNDMIGSPDCISVHVVVGHVTINMFYSLSFTTSCRWCMTSFLLGLQQALRGFERIHLAEKLDM